jgi:hypothetical protein
MKAGWAREFEEPIMIPPRGPRGKPRELVTLKDAGEFIAKFSRAPQNKTAPVYQIGAVARRALGGNDGSGQSKIASAQNGFILNLGVNFQI